MAWGGGGMGGGGAIGGGAIGGGGMFGAPQPGGHPSSPGAGLPFAGIPSELAERVEKLVANEPEVPEPEIEFSHVMPRQEPLNMRRLVAPYWRPVLFICGLVIVETVSLQTGPKLTQIGIDRGIARGHFGVVVAAALAFAGAVVLTGLSTGWRVAWTGRISSRIMSDLRVRVFSHLQRLSLDFYTDEKAGVIMTRMTSDIEALQQLFQDGLVQFAIQGLTMLVVAAVLLSMNLRLALITLLLVVPVLAGLSLWFRAASERGYNRVRDGIANVLSDLSESLSGMRIIHATNRQLQNTIHHRNVVGEYQDANNYTAHISAVYGPGTEFIGAVGQAILLFIGGRMVLHHQLTIGALTAFILYLNSFFAPIQTLVQLYNTYQQGQAAVVKLRELLQTTPSVPESLDAFELPPIEGEVRLTDVAFGYDPSQPVLSDVNLTIAAGETFSLVGPTGAGKSTIAKLVARFYDPTEGRVLVDGYDLRHVTIESLRRQLGVVPQEPYLFSGTMRDNIAFARPDATDSEVMEAVHRVGLTELIDRLPEGMDTIVHERGSSLASGERQLLALARAFLAGPRVLILDEATSNLDLRSETKVEAALDVVLRGRTAIIIAHRLSTAMRADRIAVVDEGRIIEVGSHDELLAHGGRYAEMYATWISHLMSEWDGEGDGHGPHGPPLTR
ncbi:MAG TPA: ABC transporter ATP-binding protein [Acidimicrobiales bacterium]|nr:ABC transporter ATP-binding protein [Acidimicrobiales bacterium]